jgi:3-deoxy-D-manno-octulosonic-acid transferase
MLLYIYKILSILTSPVLFLLILYRTNQGKEDLSRLGERFGYSTAKKTKPVIWLHCASVGETMIALNLIKILAKLYKSHQFLLTSGTVTSSSIVLKSKLANLTHQYTPLDLGFCVKNFIKFWRPELGILIESEIWPNLVDIATQNFPVLLVNATMSDTSYKKWFYFRSLIVSIVNKFSVIMTKDEGSEDKFKKLGAKNVVHLGNLKFANAKPNVDSKNFNDLSNQIDQRQVLLAASTHEGDDDFILNCYNILKKTHKNLLLIIAPRHPARSGQIIKSIIARNLTLSVRSKNHPINQEVDVYLADTIGELGLFYSLANVSFIGGSLKNGGHNIIEPSYFNNLILFGPDMSNFFEIAKNFIENRGAIMCRDLAETTETINYFLDNPEQIKAYNVAAKKIVDKKKNIMSDYLNYISKFLSHD